MFLSYPHIRLKYIGHFINIFNSLTKNLSTIKVQRYKIEFIPEFIYSSDTSKLTYSEAILVIFGHSVL